MAELTASGAPPLRRPRHVDPALAVWLLLIGVLLFLVVTPLVILVRQSFEVPDGVGWTLANYVGAFSDRLHLQALGNLLLLGAGVALTAAIFAVPMAWAVARTDMPGKSLVRLFVLGAF